MLQIKTKVFLAKPYCFVEIGNWVYCCIQQILIDFVLIFGLDKHIGGNKACRLQGRQFRNLNTDARTVPGSRHSVVAAL